MRPVLVALALASATRGGVETNERTRVAAILAAFDGLPTAQRTLTASDEPSGSADRATIQAALDNRSGLPREAIVEVTLLAGTYTIDAPLLVPSRTVLRGEYRGAVEIVLTQVGLGALVQKPGLYSETASGALTLVHVANIAFDLLSHGTDPYDPRDAYCCPAISAFHRGDNTASRCPATGSCPALRPKFAGANSPVFFHALDGRLNSNILFANVSTNSGVYVQGSYPSACGRKTNGVFNWAFGPTKQLAIVNCTIDRAGRDSLDIAGASEQVTLAGLNISNSQDDCISLHASSLMWYTPVNVSGQPSQHPATLTFNESGTMHDVLITRCHLWNGAARGIDLMGTISLLNISANRIGPTARAGILLDTTPPRFETGGARSMWRQSGVIEANDYVGVGGFSNGLLNRCTEAAYEHVARKGNGSSGVVVGHALRMKTDDDRRAKCRSQVVGKLELCLAVACDGIA